LLKRIDLHEVGPSKLMEVNFAPRLNFLTGDNGLGKTFILDVAWWALTGRWARQPALPRFERNKGTQPRFDVDYDEKTMVLNPISWVHSFGPDGWKKTSKKEIPKATVLYVRYDGGICMSDPSGQFKGFVASPNEVWDGFSRSGKEIYGENPAMPQGDFKVCNGLIDDWTTWQYHPKYKESFEKLKQVLLELSPSKEEQLILGEPKQTSIMDVTEYPILQTSYGIVPVTHASAGMRRILSVAYMLVWLWLKEKEKEELTKEKSTNRFVLLFDEVESHLHPQWQRKIMPALMKVVEMLNPEVDIQFIASTHAPLVLASMETMFDEDKDSLINFELKNGNVEVETLSWQAYGEVSNWLTSDVFGLGAARSIEAEHAIKEAKDSIDQAEMPTEKLKSIHNKLRAVLKDTDPFWPRWLYYAERKGIEL
jgi:AAA domain, putative AbiEii toxin, Type IV TA system